MTPREWFYRDLRLSDPPMRGLDVACLQLLLGLPTSGVYDLITAQHVDMLRAGPHLPPGPFDDTLARLLEETP